MKPKTFHFRDGPVPLMRNVQIIGDPNCGLNCANSEDAQAVKPAKGKKLLVLAEETKEGWCRRGDSNPHELPHTPLKRARLPVPPLRPLLSK